MAKLKMSNGHKTTALVVLALVALAGIVFNSVMIWFQPVPVGNEMTLMTISFLKDIILMIIGFLTGSSAPDFPHPKTPDQTIDSPKE